MVLVKYYNGHVFVGTKVMAEILKHGLAKISVDLLDTFNGVISE